MSEEQFQEIEIESVFAQAKAVEDRIVDDATRYGYDEECLFALRLSLEEALTNAIRHGNRNEIHKKVSVRYLINRHRTDIHILDEGAGFDPSQVPDPTQPEYLARPSGRGIMLMRAYMNLVEYNAIGNGVHLVKFRHNQETETR